MRDMWRESLGVFETHRTGRWTVQLPKPSWWCWSTRDSAAECKAVTFVRSRSIFVKSRIRIRFCFEWLFFASRGSTQNVATQQFAETHVKYEELPEILQKFSIGSLGLSNAKFKDSLPLKHHFKDGCQIYESIFFALKLLTTNSEPFHRLNNIRSNIVTRN